MQAQILTIEMRTKQGKNRVLLEIECEGSIRLQDFAKFIADTEQLLKSFERSQTGQARATLSWFVERSELKTVEPPDTEGEV